MECLSEWVPGLTVLLISLMQIRHWLTVAEHRTRLKELTERPERPEMEAEGCRAL